MAIKLIAVDMDGTFLNSEMTYNRPRFEALLERMKQKNIRFVCASGNQLPKLLYYFQGLESDITFVAENGAYIVDRGEVLFASVMDKEMVSKGIDALQSYSDVPFAICGKETAYIRKGTEQKYLDIFAKYYVKLEEVTDLHGIKDEIVKFTTTFEIADVTHIIRYLNEKLGDHITPVASGFGFIDLLLADVHKGRGLALLQERWGISPDECAAFGDSPNDIEMLKQVTYSYAMGNAVPNVKAIAAFEIGHHNTESVLDTIEKLIG